MDRESLELGLQIIEMVNDLPNHPSSMMGGNLSTEDPQWPRPLWWGPRTLEQSNRLFSGSCLLVLLDGWNDKKILIFWHVQKYHST